MADVIIYQTASGNPAIMAAAPDVDLVTLIDDLPAGTLHFTMADNDLPGGGVAAMDVDFVASKVSAKPPDLETLKTEALTEARATALQVRKQVTGQVDVNRALGWVLKAQFANLWASHDLAPSPTTATLAAIAQQGFELEAGFTGEDATAIRDRSLIKAGAFFLANQIVEGMERLAENDITAVTTVEELETKITELRTLEAQALEQLANLAA